MAARWRACVIPHLSALAVVTTVASLDPPEAPWLQDQPSQAIGLGPVAGTYGYVLGRPAGVCALAHEHDVVIIHGTF